MERTRVSGIAIAALAAVFFVTGCASTVKPSLADQGSNKVGSKVKCYAANSCKGRSDCKSAQNACTGKNACAGQGFQMMLEGECMAVLGTRLPQS